MPITPIDYTFLYPQPNSSIDVRPLSTNRKVMLTKSSSPIREFSVGVGSTSTGEPLNGAITSPMHIPGSTSKLADSLSKSPTGRELISTAIKHSLKVANSPPMHRRSYSLSSSPGKPSSLQIRIDDQHLTHKNVQIFDSSLQQQKFLRKKSGEVVRPVLKPSAASKSEPSTPTCSKNVRFDTNLEHVRLFLPAETPADVIEDAVVDDLLTVLFPNLPPATTSGPQGKTVYVDVGSLGLDGKTFIGKVQVQNLAYHKRVNVHYTFDFWKTISEIQADYKGSTAAKSLNGPTHDIFSFSIPLDGKVGDDVSSKDEQNTMCFAVKYSVNGRDYWDNNNGCNYRAEFNHVLAPSSSPALPKAASAKLASKRTTGNVSAKEFGVSPPSFSSSPDMTSVPVSKSATKKNFSQYNHNLSFITEKKNPSLKPQTIGQFPSHPQRVKPAPSYFNPTPGTMDDGHPISNYSEDSLSSVSISPAHWKERVVAPISAPVPMAKRPPSEKAVPKETTTGHYTFGTLPINCPRPNANSPTYYDLVQKYCFYRTSSSPCSGSPYSNSPPTMIIS